MLVGFGCLFAAWAMGTPIGSAADEPYHYVKAVAAAYGQWSGEVVVRPAPQMTSRDQKLASVTRAFRIPARFALRSGHPNGPLSCIIDKQVSAACQEDPIPPWALEPTVPLPGFWDARPTITAPSAGGPQASYVGVYQPFLYAPFGAAARLAPTAESGFRAARLAGGMMCIVLLCGALRCVRTRGRLLGVVMAVTPTAVFLASAVTTNSLEIFSSLAFVAAGLRLADGNPQRETWGWLAVSGSVLALSRGTGPSWLAVDVVVLLALLGVRKVVTLVRENLRAAIATAVVVGLSCLASMWWSMVNMTEAARLVAEDTVSFTATLRHLPTVLNGALGLFGWCDTPMPAPLYPFARILVGAAVGIALIIGTWRHRLLLAGTAVIWAAATTTLIAANPGVCPGGQARYTLAVAVVLPLLCAHVLAVRGRRVGRWAVSVLPAAGLACVAFLQSAAWYGAARRYAVGNTGSWLFLIDPEWAPPAGWWPWLLCAVAGSVLIVVGGLHFPETSPEEQPDHG